jgi:hypothetical protein
VSELIGLDIITLWMLPVVMGFTKWGINDSRSSLNAGITYVELEEAER